MKRSGVKGLVTLLVVSGIGNGVVRAESELFQVYLKFERAVAACEDVGCYRSVLQMYGSSSTREKLGTSTDQQLQQPFETARGVANDRLKRATNADLYVDQERIDGDAATLILNIRSSPGLTSTVYLVREDGTWKIGKTHAE